MGKADVIRFLKHVLIPCVVAAVLVSSFMGLAYWRDPLHLFRAPEGELYLHSNMRIQAAGIINSFAFDSIILGTSMLENSSSADMEKALGGTFVNLSLSGANFMERSHVLSYALKRKKIRRIFYSIDRYYLSCPVTYYYPSRFWTFLYDDSRMNDMKAYASSDDLKKLFLGKSPGRKRSLDRPNEWMSRPYHACRFGGIQNWVSNMDKQGVGNFLKDTLPKAASAAKVVPLVPDKERSSQSTAYVEEYVLSYAEKNRETKFYLVFPPYWRYYFASMRQTEPADFAVHQDVVRHVVERASVLGNVHVFGFEDCAFVDDIANYKDVSHYHESINEYMAESMGAGRHRLTPDNVEAYLARCEELARNFDIKALNEEVQALLAKHGK